MESLGPFGQGNPKPHFLVKNLEVVSTRAVGKEGKHAQLFLRHEVLNGSRLKCIAFSHGYLSNALKEGDKLDLIGELMTDEWNGRSDIQLRLIDWRKSD